METKRHAEKPAYNRKSKYRDDPLESVEAEFDSGDTEDEPAGLEDATDESDESSGNDEGQDSRDQIRRKQGGRG